jgi:hypothetical protein
VSQPADRDECETVDAQVRALVGAGHSRIEATVRTIERAATDARHASTVVLVEGLSDQIVLEVLAGRQGRALNDEGTFVVATGGATNFARSLAVFGPAGYNVRLAGLYDSPMGDRIRRTLDAAGVRRIDGPVSLEALGFFACVRDLEDEMIRALGPTDVEAVVTAEGELESLRRLQGMPFHRQRSLADQLHRFMGSRTGRKYRYARALALALDLGRLPPPLAGLLEQL